jgi:hypothetical protein
MNGYLGSTDGAAGGGVLKLSDITRTKSEVFFFAEENMWLRPGCSWVLNDNALCPDGRDWFATFHSTSSKDLNGGTCNAVGNRQVKQPRVGIEISHTQVTQ